MTAVARRNALRSPRRIAQTPSCIVTELRTRTAVSVAGDEQVLRRVEVERLVLLLVDQRRPVGEVSRTLKYAAKSPAKNITSEAMNRTIPRIGLLIPRRAWPWASATPACGATADVLSGHRQCPAVSCAASAAWRWSKTGRSDRIGGRWSKL